MKMDLLFFFFMFITLALFILYINNFRLHFYSLKEVYEIRRIARGIKYIPLQGYILAICRSLIPIVGIYLFIFRKKVSYLFITLLIAFSIFSFNASKNVLFIPIYLMLISIYIKYSKSLIPFVFIFLAIVFLGIFEWKLVGTSFLSEMFVRRILAVPGFLNIAYYNFFSSHSKVFLTDSILLKHFVEPIYPLPYTFLIGLEYFNNPAMNADAGIWMAGFAHFGCLGAIAVSCIGGFILGLIDNMLKKEFYYLACLVCAYLGVNWCEQALHTSVLTGGLLYIFLMIIFILHSVHLRKEFICRKVIRR